MKVRKFSFKDLNNFITGMSPGLVTEVAHKYTYVDGKRSDTVESTNISCVCNGLGEVTLVFPPSDKLLEAIAKEYPFGTPLLLNDIGAVDDVNISIYDNRLMFKIKMKEF